MIQDTTTDQAFVLEDGTASAPGPALVVAQGDRCVAVSSDGDVLLSVSDGGPAGRYLSVENSPVFLRINGQLYARAARFHGDSVSVTVCDVLEAL